MRNRRAILEESPKYWNINNLSDAVNSTYYSISIMGSESKGKKKDGVRKNKPGMPKYWVVKELLDGQNKNLFDMFASDAITDSIVTHIYHAIDPLAARTKIVSPYKSVSRIYSLDGENVRNVDTSTETYNMLNKLVGLRGDEVADLAKKGKIKGLLQALVYRIVIGDWDNKLQNYSMCGDVSKGYHIAPIDMSMIFKEVYEKIWDFESLRSLFYDNEGNVVKNLAETISGIGSRTNDFYMRKASYTTRGKTTIKLSQPDSVHRNKIQEKVEVILRAELDAHKKAHNITTDEEALIDIFGSMVRVVVSNFNQVAAKVRDDINDKNKIVGGNKVIPSYHVLYQENLKNTEALFLEKFLIFHDNIKKVGDELAKKVDKERYAISRLLSPTGNAIEEAFKRLGDDGKRFLRQMEASRNSGARSKGDVKSMLPPPPDLTGAGASQKGKEQARDRGAKGG